MENRFPLKSLCSKITSFVSNSTDSCQQLLKPHATWRMSVCREFQHLEVPILWVIFLVKKLSPSHYIFSELLGISFLNRAWLLILTSLSNVQLPPQLAGISRQLKIFIRFMETCIQNQNTNHKCYTLPKVMPASQSWQVVLVVWNGEGKNSI